MFTVVMNDEQPVIKRGLPSIHPNKKVSDEDWVTIRHMSEQGMGYDELGKQYGVMAATIAKRASKERWLTPTRIARAKNGNVAVDDPAAAVAALWQRRGVETRDQVYQGAQKALERFFAMCPVPQSFAEASHAHKMLKESINPNGEIEQKVNYNIQVLTSQDFKPTPVIEV